MRAPRGMLPCALLLTLLMVVSPAVHSDELDDLFAEIFGATAPQDLQVPVFLDSFFLGEVPLRVAPQLVEVHLASLGETLNPHLNDIARMRLDELSSLPPYVAIGQLASEGIHLRYLPDQVRLDVDLSPDLRSRLVLRDGESSPAGNLQQPVPLSAFMNLTGRAVVSSLEQFNVLQAEVEPVLNYQGWVLEAGIGLTAAATPPDEVAILRHMRVVRDVPALRLRAEAGTVRYERSSLMARREIIGISVTRIDEIGGGTTLFRRNPVEFTVREPGPVDVYLNDRLYRSYRLQPGPHQIPDVPLGRGTSQVEIRQDEVLHTETRYHSPELLEPGSHLYSAALGVERDNLSPEGLLLNLWHRMGVLPQWTVGFSGQASLNQWKAGVHSVVASPAGVTRGDAALYLDDTGATGGAGEISHAIALLHVPRAPTLELLAGLQSGEYRQIFAEQPAGNLLRGAIGINHRFSPAVGGTAAVVHRRRLSGPSHAETAVRLSLGFRAREGISATAQIGPVFSDDGMFWRGSVFLRIAGSGSPIETIVNYDFAQGPATLQVGRPAPTPYRSWGWTAALQGFDLEAGSPQILDGTATYSGYRGSVQLQPRYQFVSGADEGELRLTGQYATAVVWAGGAPVVSRPVQNSFAVFQPRSHILDYPVAIRPGGGATAGMIDGRRAVFPELAAWRTTRIVLDSTYLPDGFSLGVSDLTFVPGYRQGYRVVVGAVASVYITGRLVDEEEQPVALEAGEIMDSVGEVLPFFTDRDGNFEVLEVLPGEYRLLLYRYPDAQVVFAVPEDETGRFDLEDVVFLREDE